MCRCERSAVVSGLRCDVGGGGTEPDWLPPLLSPAFSSLFSPPGVTHHPPLHFLVSSCIWSPHLSLFGQTSPSDVPGSPGCSCEWHSRALPALPLRQPHFPVLGATFGSLKPYPFPRIRVFSAPRRAAVPGVGVLLLSGPGAGASCCCGDCGAPDSQAEGLESAGSGQRILHATYPIPSSFSPGLPFPGFFPLWQPCPLLWTPMI